LRSESGPPLWGKGEGRDIAGYNHPYSKFSFKKPLSNINTANFMEKNIPVTCGIVYSILSPKGNLSMSNV